MDSTNYEKTSSQELNKAGSVSPNQELKFCKHCGQQIPKDAIICTACGRQVEEFATPSNAQQPSIVIQNTSTNTNTNAGMERYLHTKERNKWVAFFLCLVLGYFGAHKFYEGKIGLGILYLCTFGLFFIGVIVDLIVILTHPNPYYV